MDQTVTGGLAFLSSGTPEADESARHLAALYGQSATADASTIVALGGDGFMLQTIHRFMNSGKPIYGMNRGSVGFLMNEYGEDTLRERIAAAERETIRPLRMTAIGEDGTAHRALAINEVSIFRETRQAAKIDIRSGLPALRHGLGEGLARHADK